MGEQCLLQHWIDDPGRTGYVTVAQGSLEAIGMGMDKALGPFDALGFVNVVRSHAREPVQQRITSHARTTVARPQPAATPLVHMVCSPLMLAHGV